MPTANFAADDGLANPATVIALANQPTPTPNLSNCPAPDETLTLDAAPDNARTVDEAITRYLSQGGTVLQLETTLRDDWAILGETGTVRGDLDLTGEGAPEIIIAYNSPDEGGVLLILGCIDGRYLARYRAALGGDAPQILNILDMNFNSGAELLFASQACSPDCTTRAQVVTWSADRGRFVNLLASPVTSPVAPTTEDIDSDQVQELIVRFTDAGDATTGPQRTGYTVYDWNGVSYVQSITQLDPPRFLIQVLHQADEALANESYEEAQALYQLALDTDSLEAWQNDDPITLRAYALYRLLTVQAFTEDSARIQTQQTISELYPDLATAPPYAAMAQAFWSALQVTNNLRSACTEALNVAAQRQDAVGLLNRYGSSSPVYSAADLCAF